MRLMEEPRPEDLEIVTYWVKENGRAWVTNEDNVPLDNAGNPFYMDENGLPRWTDPQETAEGESGAILSLPEHDEPIPERLVFKLKMLLGRDHNAITQAMIQTKTKSSRRGRNRAVVETDIDLAKSVNLKLHKAIVEWEGLIDKDDKPVPVSPEAIDLLPAWIQNDLLEIVNDMSELNEEEEGE